MFQSHIRVTYSIFMKKIVKNSLRAYWVKEQASQTCAEDSEF
jgi:hypothetical protein